VLLNECYGAVTDTAPLMKRLREADQTPDEGLERGTISQEDRDRIAKMEDLVHEVVAVDDFTREELAGLYPGLDAQVSQKEAAE
jgi:acyl-CoA dehydrogenase